MNIYKHILTLCVFTLSLLSGEGQKSAERFSLTGKITNTNNEILDGASIYISDLKKGSIADAYGKYQIKNIPRGTYLVEIKFIGYKTIVDHIYFDENKTADFSLNISITEENEIVITGSSKATSLKRNPIPIISISKQYLQSNLSTNIIDAISNVPGLSAVTTGPNVSKPFIRGLGFNRILTLYDGVRQEGQQWGAEHGIEVDQNTVEKVEVIKGPASLIYGSDAIAGVVNLIPANPPLKGHILGNINSEYQTNNGLVENSVDIAGNQNGLRWGTILSHKMASNYQNKYDGRVYNTGFKELNLSGNVEVNKTWGYSRTGVSMFDNLQEIPSGKRDSASRKFEKLVSEHDDEWEIVSDKELRSYQISDVYQRVQHYRIYNSSSFILGGDRLALNLGFQRSMRREFEDPEVSAPALFLELNTWTYDAKYFFHESQGTSITAGLNGMLQDNKVERGHEFIIPSYKQFDIGPFLYVKKSIGKLEIAGGARYDVRNFRNNDLYVEEDPITGLEIPVYGKDTVGAEQLFYANNQTFNGASGSLGISYRFNKEWSAKVNLGRGYRAPNVSEISSNGVHAGTKIYQLGNRHFIPEFNFQQDIGVTYNSEHVTINMDLFNNDIQNYIYNQKVLNAEGGDSIIVPGNQTFQYVASRANLTGGELVVDIHPHPLDWLHFENSLSVVYGINKGVKNGPKISEEGKYLPFIPPFHTRSELRGNFVRVGKNLANAFVKVQFEMYAKQNRAYLENDTETPTSGYNLFHAGIGTDVNNRKGDMLFNITFFGNNLFDVAYQSHLNRMKYFEDYPGNFTGRDGIYNMGRNFSIKINVPLRIKNH
ncbi:MAG: TonB-dependent receptor [Ginsengibacter sp.]